MKKIKVYLSDGRVRLGQWDTNRYLTVEGVSSIWFKWDEASAVQGEIIENQVKIPDELLQKSGTLVIYAGLGTALEKVFYFTVTSAERPNDYVYTPTDILTWTELDRRISELENKEPPQLPAGNRGDILITDENGNLKWTSNLPTDISTSVGYQNIYGTHILVIDFDNISANRKTFMVNGNGVYIRYIKDGNRLMQYHVGTPYMINCYIMTTQQAIICCYYNSGNIKKFSYFPEDFNGHTANTFLQENIVYSAKDCDTLLNGKLPINQGADNAGKYLSVGNDGYITLTNAPSGGSGGSGGSIGGQIVERWENYNEYSTDDRFRTYNLTDKYFRFKGIFNIPDDFEIIISRAFGSPCSIIGENHPHKNNYVQYQPNDTIVVNDWTKIVVVGQPGIISVVELTESFYAGGKTIATFAYTGNSTVELIHSASYTPEYYLKVLNRYIE